MRRVALLAGLGVLGGCGAPERTPLTVLAASSLTDVFGELERRFEAEHPEVDVVVAFGGTQALATQIRHGLRADVLASADEAHVTALAAEGLVEAPRPFAHNALVLAVADGAGDVAWRDLPELERLVVGDADVPLGRYTSALLDDAGERYGAAWRAAVEARVVSREPHARAVSAKVALGEADAAIVYATDVPVGHRAIGWPDGPVATYHHAALTEAPEPGLARAWTTFVASPDGRAALEAHGFGLPSP